MTDSQGSQPAAGEQSIVLRESHVRQAMGFLRDPRVSSAPLSHAVNFLHSKNMTDIEVREAFRRLRMPYPDIEVPLGYYPVEPRRGSSWFGTLLTATAVAGALYGIREVVRRYIVPLYVPELVDAVAQGDSAQEHNARVIKRQESQIGRWERYRCLCVSQC